MYAVFKSGGKQYRAAKGDVLRLEKIDAAEGATVNFDEVLLVGQGADLKVGNPLLAGSSVSARVLRQGKSRKVPVVKFKRRQNYLRQGSHRQFFTEVEITGIGAAKAAPRAKEAAGEEKPAAKTPAKKAGADKTAAGGKKAAASEAAKKPAKKPAKKKAAKKTARKKGSE